MRYYIGAEARLRRTVEDVAMSVFEGWNYEEVITPVWSDGAESARHIRWADFLWSAVLEPVTEG